MCIYDWHNFCKYNKLNEIIKKIWKDYKYIIQNDKNIKWIEKIKFKDYVLKIIEYKIIKVILENN